MFFGEGAVFEVWLSTDETQWCFRGTTPLEVMLLSSPKKIPSLSHSNTNPALPSTAGLCKTALVSSSATAVETSSVRGGIS